VLRHRRARPAQRALGGVGARGPDLRVLGFAEPQRARNFRQRVKRDARRADDVAQLQREARGAAVMAGDDVYSASSADI